MLLAELDLHVQALVVQMELVKGTHIFGIVDMSQNLHHTHIRDVQSGLSLIPDGFLAP